MQGGIKSLGGAKLEMVFGDARSTPDGGAQEVERMASEGVAAIVGGFASPICLAATQAARATTSPTSSTSASPIRSSRGGSKNTFRFAPGFGMASKQALDNLVKLNDAAGKPAKTVVLVHEDGLFGSGLAKLMQDRTAQASASRSLTLSPIRRLRATCRTLRCRSAPRIPIS